jgi:hypothetical protein
MSVTVNSVKLQNRLRRLATTLPVAAAQATNLAAEETIDVISNAIRAEWADNNQVGFDLDNFINIISKRVPLQGGGIGILNTDEMGTADDFKNIYRIKGLWHYGTGSGERFGLFINQTSWIYDQVAEMIRKRKYFWGDREPQWYLIEYGTTGSPGVYDPRAPTMTITTAALDMVPRVYAIVENTVNRILQRNGVFS